MWMRALRRTEMWCLRWRRSRCLLRLRVSYRILDCVVADERAERQVDDDCCQEGARPCLRRLATRRDKVADRRLTVLKVHPRQAQASCREVRHTSEATACSVVVCITPSKKAGAGRVIAGAEARTSVGRAKA